ncbi:hypothetical protein ACEQ8H_007404 [Pleosporales sp. CAS-2024a]
MVRLFIPEGEGQHAIARRHPDPLPPRLELFSLPQQSVLYAVGITACLALAGKSRPGYFLKATAYISAANLSIAALDGYSSREVNRAVLKMDGAEPKPGRLWERTEHWTMEDVMIAGGIMGSLLASNPRALPGARGWKRFLGATTVGWAAGGYIGARQEGFARLPPQVIGVLQATDDVIRETHYHRLKDNVKAQESLSRWGKIALTCYTWPIWGLLINPFRKLAESQSAGTAGSSEGVFRPAQGPHGGLTNEELEQHTLFQIEFNKGELRAPDMENGYRAFKDSLADRDDTAIHEWIEQLDELLGTLANEAQCVWRHLAVKEREFYRIEREDREKDIARRELQLLNNIASDLYTKSAIIRYQIADAQKRLAQTANEEHMGFYSTTKTLMMPTDTSTDWQNRYNPQIITEQVRLNWLRQKEVLSILEHNSAMHSELKPTPGSMQEKQLKKMQENAEYMKKNFEATERLLKELEEQIRRAEAYTEETKSVNS